MGRRAGIGGGGEWITEPIQPALPENTKDRQISLRKKVAILAIGYLDVSAALVPAPNNAIYFTDISTQHVGVLS